jgi:hypothetical protein
MALAWTGLIEVEVHSEGSTGGNTGLEIVEAASRIEAILARSYL